LGCAQLEQIDGFLKKKQEIAALYESKLANIREITLMPTAPGVHNAKWLYTIRLKDQSSRPLLQHLDAQGIQTRPLWQPMHLSPANANLNSKVCPVAETLNRECLSLPCSVGLTIEDQE